ncbi:hypothetical protein D3C72_2488490 [compost metagenome]
MALETDMAIVCSVAVNLYQTSCEEPGAHDGAAPSCKAPLNVPKVLVQVLLGASSAAFAQVSFAGFGKA